MPLGRARCATARSLCEHKRLPRRLGGRPARAAARLRLQYVANAGSWHYAIHSQKSPFVQGSLRRTPGGAARLAWDRPPERGVRPFCGQLRHRGVRAHAACSRGGACEFFEERRSLRAIGPPGKCPAGELAYVLVRNSIAAFDVNNV